MANHSDDGTIWQWTTGVLGGILVATVPVLHRLIKGGIDHRIDGLAEQLNRQDVELSRISERLQKMDERALLGFERLAKTEAEIDGIKTNQQHGLAALGRIEARLRADTHAP